MADIIEVLISEKLITPEQANDARDKQLGAQKPIQDLLVEMGFIAEADLIRVASRIFNMPLAVLDQEVFQPEVLKLIPYDNAKRFGVFPLRREKDLVNNDILVLATSDPQDIEALDQVKIAVNMPVKPILSSRSDINRFIEKFYHLDDLLYDILKNSSNDSQVKVIDDQSKARKPKLSEVMLEDSPLVKLVNLILSDAVDLKASDIHIEPRDGHVTVRYRIDGDLKNIIKVPTKVHLSLVARLKVMASLDITENRKPQDGRITIQIEGRGIDLRISTIPTYYGEKVVLRLFDAKEAKTQIDRVGFSEDELVVFKEAVNKPQGMVLVTGPTGSGKTSTLYAALNFIKSEAKNIVTIEDPVEYLIDGINQTQVNPAIGVTFANTLRSILRQDPNIILVGEIRDTETAEIAFRASLTGHLVFSTLHTNSAAGAVTRLLDMGVEPYLVSSSVLIIEAQRLVRMNCAFCKEEYTPDEKISAKLMSYCNKMGIKKFYRGKGCQKCHFSGLSGRTAIFELLVVNEKVRGLISRKASEDAINEAARENGLKLLIESALAKVALGIIPLEEVAKVGDGADQRSGGENNAQYAPDKLKILVVDDEEDIRVILGKRLEKEGYQALQAQSGLEAIECVYREKPDLLILDLNLPDMDGFQVTRVLRSKLETSVIPILMLTAREDKQSEIKGLEAGADDYLTKPCDIDKLFARIRMLLKRKDNRER